ncbi:dual oxidase maturation factor 1-like [Pollicipes pollicipes]|uniref:dual oxidase maturation factor 1-like n=1 Tax=Pollicipes pollicipes TaxID=41117 RepID=UPI0018857EAD|nr:dual oxidase maturation factor 1-like [Pollicipes pollicipes]
MKGWFDAFRTDGGPTLYHHSNRTAVHGDAAVILISVIFVTVLVAFLLIFPGVRSQRLSTFVCVTLSLFTGLAITLGATGSSWQSGSVDITSFYRAFSSERLQASLGAHIGLNHVNITLTALRSAQDHGDVAFNERFRWGKPMQMRDEYRAALVKGLPYPILTVAEYLSANSEGFAWGRRLKSAGYYTSIVIWTAFASWLLTNLLLLTVPRYGAYLMVVTGGLMCLACGLYSALQSGPPLAPRRRLHWTAVVSGIMYMLVGLVASILDLVHPHTFSTILEVDFGTPYDRHMLIVESDESRKRPTLKIPKLEEPITAGIEATTKLIRRLSKRSREDSSTDPRGGADNVAFEMETPTVPLHRQSPSRRGSKQSGRSAGSRRGSRHLDVPQLSVDLPAVPARRPLERTDSRHSQGSSLSASSVSRSSLPDGEQHSFQEQFKRIRRAESPRRDSSQSGDSNASSGCSLFRSELTRGGSLHVPVPVTSCPSGSDALHPPLEKRDSRASNIIVFHTQDARGQLTRRQSSDRASIEM